MGSSESSRKKNGSFSPKKFEMKREPVRKWTREEVIKALTVDVTTDDKGKEIVKSELLDLLNGPKMTAGSEFSWTSIYDPNDPDKDACSAKALGDAPFSDPSEDRAFGALFGMAVGDAMGHVSNLILLIMKQVILMVWVKVVLVSSNSSLDSGQMTQAWVFVLLIVC